MVHGHAEHHVDDLSGFFKWSLSRSDSYLSSDLYCVIDDSETNKRVVAASCVKLF